MTDILRITDQLEVFLDGKLLGRSGQLNLEPNYYPPYLPDQSAAKVSFYVFDIPPEPPKPPKRTWSSTIGLRRPK